MENKKLGEIFRNKDGYMEIQWNEKAQLNTDDFKQFLLYLKPLIETHAEDPEQFVGSFFDVIIFLLSIFKQSYLEKYINNKRSIKVKKAAKEALGTYQRSLYSFIQFISPEHTRQSEEDSIVGAWLQEIFLPNNMTFVSKDKLKELVENLKDKFRTKTVKVDANVKNKKG